MELTLGGVVGRQKRIRPTRDYQVVGRATLKPNRGLSDLESHLDEAVGEEFSEVTG